MSGQRAMDSQRAQPTRLGDRSWAVGTIQWDWVLAIGIGFFFALLYGVLAWRVTRGHFFEHYNLIFDYDSPAYADIFRGSHIDEAGRAIKHPLIPWLSVLTVLLRGIGFGRLAAAAIAGAGIGGATAAIFFLFSRRVGAPLIEAVLVTLIFATGAAQLFPSMLVESYIYAALTLSIVWYLSALRLDNPARLQRAAIVTAVMTFGVTITNVMQAAIAEFFVQLSGQRFSTALRKAVVLGALVALLCVVAVAITWPEAVVYAVKHPGIAARIIYWQQTKGPKTGIGQVLLTFFGLSLAAPNFSLIALPEGILMRDFRTLDMPWIEIGAIILWVGLLGLSAYAALRDKRLRPLAVALLTAFLFNVVLNSIVQFRGSLFIYTPHIWIAIASLVALGAAAWQPANAHLRWYLRGALVVVLVVIAPLNLERAASVATLFDSPNTFTIPAVSH